MANAQNPFESMATIIDPNALEILLIESEIITLRADLDPFSLEKSYGITGDGIKRIRGMLIELKGGREIEKNHSTDLGAFRSLYGRK